MTTNILDKLKVKEEEMEAVVREARKKAVSMKDEASRRASEIKEDALKEIDKAIGEIASREEEEFLRIAREIEGRAGKEAEQLKKKAALRMDEAVRKVMEIVAEAACDKGDDEGPDNRAKKPSR